MCIAGTPPHSSQNVQQEVLQPRAVVGKLSIGMVALHLHHSRICLCTAVVRLASMCPKPLLFAQPWCSYKGPVCVPGAASAPSGVPHEQSPRQEQHDPFILTSIAVTMTPTLPCHCRSCLKNWTCCAWPSTLRPSPAACWCPSSICVRWVLKCLLCTPSRLLCPTFQRGPVIVGQWCPAARCCTSEQRCLATWLSPCACLSRHDYPLPRHSATPLVWRV